MNVFLLSPNIQESCAELATLDPRRARKQLLECCQILASVELALTGACTMRKANGEIYGRSHPHHPCVVQASRSYWQWVITRNVALHLANIYPAHACFKSIKEWICKGGPYPFKEPDPMSLVVVRRNHPHTYVNTLAEYAALSRPYFMAKLQGSSHA